MFVSTAPLGGSGPHIRHRRMADVAWAAHTSIPASNHGLVPARTTTHFPRGNLSGKVTVLPPLWSWIPGLVCLLAIGCLRLCLAVGAQQIQDHYM